MKVTVTKYLNVRVGKPSLNAPCYQYLAPGSEIEVDGKLYKGNKDDGVYEGINTWMKDETGNYYWSGGVSGLPTDQHTTLGKVTFGWFNKLNIADVWQVYQAQGDQVKVAVLDSGYAHNNPDLVKIRANDTKVIIDQTHYTAASLVINDISRTRHGTRCAALIGAMNTQDWIVGIAPACKLLIAKTSTDQEFLDYSYMIRGIEWALAQNADIISASFAFNLTKEQAIDFNQQITRLIGSRQILLFAAAGNTNGTPQSYDYYPAMFDNFVSVGAVTAVGTLSPITALNSRTFIHAFGENVESYGKSNVPTPESGTSFATPIVAGIAALAVSYLKQRNGSWKSSDLLTKIYSTGDPIMGHQNRKIINPNKLFQNLLK